ncbi:uncharacterized protein LOC117716746 [Arvicanthis niloticus]|uniref:uncharacterized protein LOC117716746 n=1 Tax=Arvicanthis niloticus TaxID=61156 RepID=UPI00403D4544
MVTWKMVTVVLLTWKMRKGLWLEITEEKKLRERRLSFAHTFRGLGPSHLALLFPALCNEVDSLCQGSDHHHLCSSINLPMHFYTTSHQSACLLFSLSNEVNIEEPGPWCWQNPGGTNLQSICFHCPPHLILTTSLAFISFPQCEGNKD